MKKRRRQMSAKNQAFRDAHLERWLEERKDNIRLAGPQPQPKVFKPKKRREVVEATLAFARRWRVTPFENEASLTHGIRSNLCLTGEQWQRAHAEAEAVVAECLSRLGAERPDWNDGQREATATPDRCTYCAGPIPEELEVGGQVHRFCSAVCARSAIQKRDFARKQDGDAAYRAARDVVYRARFEAIECRSCSKSFRPRGENRSFCSPECVAVNNAKRLRVLPDRACAQCGTSFRPQNAKRFLCSRECAVKARSTWAADRTCKCCGTEFIAGSPKAECCSMPCAQLWSRLRKGDVRRVSPQVFDALFKGRRPSRSSVTAGLFEAA